MGPPSAAPGPPRDSGIPARFPLVSIRPAAPALVLMAGLPCAAEHTVISVQNLTAVPWDLVDTTQAPSGATYWLDLLQPGAGPDPESKSAGARVFPVAPGATVTLAVQTSSRRVARLSFALRPGPGNTRPPVAGASLHPTVGYRSWGEATDGAGQPHPLNRFTIQPNGSFGSGALPITPVLLGTGLPGDLRPPRPPEGPGGEGRFPTVQRLEGKAALKGNGLEILEDGHRARFPARTRGRSRKRAPLAWNGGMPPAGPDPAPRPTPLAPPPALNGAVAAPSEAEALRRDLAESTMFLGHEAGQWLAERLGLGVDVHIPVRRHPDGMGRTVIGARSRFGPLLPTATPVDGLILLNHLRHFTLLRPASPEEEARFVTEDGRPFREITRTVPDPRGNREAPVIPADGHCLVSALHYLRAGALPEPSQVWRYRAEMAARAGDEALATLVAELRREILAEGFQLLPEGRFATLGPAFSARLTQDPTFMAQYEAALRKTGAPSPSDALPGECPSPPSPARRDDSPGVPLEITEDLLPALPLHAIPESWQEATRGKPRMLLVNRSAAPWYVVPWQGNRSSFRVAEDGRVRPMNPKRSHPVPPQGVLLVFVEGKHGIFGIHDGASQEIQTVAHLRPQDTLLPGRARAGRNWRTPPGVFFRRLEDAQSFVIFADRYPPDLLQQFRAFPATPADYRVPILTAAGPVPPLSEELAGLLDLERQFADGNIMIVLNQSEVPWYLDLLDAGDGRLPGPASGELPAPLPGDRRLRLDPGSQTPILLPGETGTLALQDDLHGTFGQVAWNGRSLAFTLEEDRTPAGAQPLRVQPVPGTRCSFRILPVQEQ